MSTFRIITSGGVLAVGILALAACGESLTGPGTQPSTQLSTVSGMRLIANHIKYKDAGHKPATGHAGSATLTVSALLGQDGMTDVDLVAGSRTGAGAPSISKVSCRQALHSPAPSSASGSAASRVAATVTRS